MSVAGTIRKKYHGDDDNDECGRTEQRLVRNRHCFLDLSPLELSPETAKFQQCLEAHIVLLEQHRRNTVISFYLTHAYFIFGLEDS